jgi:hypothetical protein
MQLISEMKQGPPLEADNCSASPEIPCLLCNLKVHYCVQKGLPLDLILSHLNSANTLTPYLFKFRFNIIFPPYGAGVAQSV